MEKDFKDFETEAPTLTLEPDFGQEETPKEEKEPAEAAVKKEMEETILTPEEDGGFFRCSPCKCKDPGVGRSRRSDCRGSRRTA